MITASEALTLSEQHVQKEVEHETKLQMERLDSVVRHACSQGSIATSVSDVPARCAELIVKELRELGYSAFAEVDLGEASICLSWNKEEEDEDSERS